ncbi:FliA/WhiG family RNA polymerase sigma factor [Thermohalobacter berrensis]|uniref:RNA polymerase sigma factor n=1 Tax=Thermohalobacter berrensis TaxID=99594 RepID=A0A419TAG4_9FIRM|nr:FliA/WhiG family RNA polymerase sigma factor [Thermohalobacter berrensis]RKD34461.1 RNA polymerase subunit sigma [Thermohalobacter berrensis]
MTKDELWKKYKDSNDIELKKRLIEEYIDLVKIVAGRMYNYYGGNVEYDDLLSYGVFGLIDAIEKFDINRNLKFETYAQIRIRGAIVDNLRKLDWIPRSLRQKTKEIEKAINKLENKLQRNVTIKDIAEELDKDESEIKTILGQTSTFNLVSLEEILTERGEYNIYSKSYDTPETIYQNKEIKKILKEVIDSLPEREKLIISLYYYDELTYKEIGEVLNLSESRISQLHSKIILQIKNNLNKIGVNNYN